MNRSILPAGSISEPNSMPSHSANTTESNPSLNALAVACHEIRGSLAAIIGHAELMHEMELTDRRRDEIAALIANSGHELLHVLDDVLLAAQIDASGVRVAMGPCRLHDIFDELLEMYAHQADARGLFFELDLSHNLPDAIVTDRNALRRILSNLVGNAVKFTETGGIRIRVEWHGESQLQIQVEDSGIGIASSELNTVFDRFVRGSGAARNVRGSGLGLALSRDLTAALSGELSVFSEQGCGSIFTVALPAAKVLPQQDHQHVDLDGLHVLVADDCLDGRRLLAHHLFHMGASTSLAENGEELVVLYESRCHDGASCDAIMLDLEMPRLDGWKTVRALRKQGYRGPVIALSAHQAGPEHQRAIAAGCDLCLSKPLERGELAHALKALLGGIQARIAG